MSKYRRPREVPVQWFVPIADDAPEGIEETQDHPHLLLRRVTMSESLQMERLRAEIAQYSDEDLSAMSETAQEEVAERMTEIMGLLADLIKNAVVGFGGLWRYYPGLVSVPQKPTLDDVMGVLSPEDWREITGAWTPTESEKND